MKDFFNEIYNFLFFKEVKVILNKNVTNTEFKGFVESIADFHFNYSATNQISKFFDNKYNLSKEYPFIGTKVSSEHYMLVPNHFYLDFTVGFSLNICIKFIDQKIVFCIKKDKQKPRFSLLISSLSILIPLILIFNGRFLDATTIFGFLGIFLTFLYIIQRKEMRDALSIIRIVSTKVIDLKDLNVEY